VTDTAVRLSGGARLRTIQTTVAALILIVLAFFVARLLNDVPHLADGTLPAEDVDRAYVEHPWLAYLHIGPGVVYLLGAPLQLAYRFRSRHYTVHRWMGRVLAPSAFVCGVFAVVFGTLHAFGGAGESVATIVFGLWFLFCLVAAVRAIKRRDVFHHRRWMIRAFAIGVGVGSIRIWVWVLTETGLLDLRGGFAVGFWLAFVTHAIVAEWWVRTSPFPGG
jgi:uncharacterized membrane protein